MVVYSTRTYPISIMVLFIIVSILALLSGEIHAVEFQIKNKENGEVWIGIQGNPGHAHLRNGGFSLGAGQQTSVHAPDNWAGRFWARTWCNHGNRHCLTGDCGNRLECAGAGGNPPASLAEITMKGYGGIDYYDISLVDGFNLKISMEPLGGRGDGSRYSCKKAGCYNPINNHCPGELQVRGPNNWVIGCKSACLAFNTDQYCCRGAHALPSSCKSSDWPRNYPAMFKGWCPDAYSYAYDDHKSTFTCRDVPAYRIEFGG